MRLALVFIDAPSGVSMDYIHDWQGGLPTQKFDYTDIIGDEITIYPTNQTVGKCRVCTYSVDNLCDGTKCLIRIVP